MRSWIASTLNQVTLDQHEWNALSSRCDTNSVFQTYQWAESWWKIFGGQYQPLFVAVSDGSGIAGIAPLIVEKGLSGESVIRILGDGRADYCDLLVPTGEWRVMRVVFDTLFSLKEWDVIELNNIPALSQTVEMVRSICDCLGYHVLIRNQFVCPVLLIQGYEESAGKILSKPSLLRRQNYFRRTGRLVCRNLTSITEIEPYLDGFFGQHIARWHHSKFPSLFIDERNQALYRDLAVNLSEKGWLLFSVVEFNGQPIAFHYGFDYNGSVIWYKPSFDVAYASRSPGLVLLHNLIGYAIDEKRLELDFTVGNEPFKARFTNAERETVCLKIYRDPAQFFFESSKAKLLNAWKRFV